MRGLFSVFILFCFIPVQAQKSFHYKAAWQRVEYLDKQKGQVKSLLPEVEKIYEAAKEEENWQQRIRAFIYREGIRSRVTDDKDYEAVIIRNFQMEIDEAEGPPKAILQSMLAETYTDYYRWNRQKVKDRTDLENSGEDFRYWSKSRFQEEVQRLYSASLQNEKELKNQRIKDWAFLLDRIPETEYLRPTLFDFLSYRYIDFLQNSSLRSGLLKRRSTIEDILDGLIRFHQHDKMKEALAYNRLERLKLLKPRHPDEFELRLRELIHTYSDNRFSPYLLFEGAKFYIDKFQNAPERSFKEKGLYAEKALYYSREILNRFPQSSLIEASQNNVKRLTTPFFRLRTEEYNAPDKMIPMRIQYRNLDKLYFKVFRYNRSQEKRINDLGYGDKKRKREKLNRIFSTLEEVQNFTLDLKLFDDYQSRRTTGKIDSLSSGYYLILSSNQPDFNLKNKNTAVGYQQLRITPYAISTQRDYILITNRETGKPIIDKKLSIYGGRNGSTLLKTVITNDKGIATYSTGDYYLSFQVEGDPIRIESSGTHKKPEALTEVEKTLQFFTDRKIYRPGQPLYYKIIAYQLYPDGTRKVIPNRELKVVLQDVNGKKVSEQELVTTEFGSLSGEFVLPNSGLNGEYSLRVTNGGWNSSTYRFRVEEYKRPKFQVKLMIKDTVYKLDEEVAIEGRATAFSGAHVPLAKVVYRVVREPEFSFLPWWYRYFLPQRAEKQQIAEGEVTTDDQGKFSIHFNAVPGEFLHEDGVLKKGSQKRSFIYSVIADVTDVNGETQSAKIQVRVGDQGYMLDFPIAEQLDINTFETLPIVVKNLNGKPVRAHGELFLAKIKAPDRVLRKTDLEETDYELYPREEFVSYFPHQPYGNENNLWNRKNGDTVFRQKFELKGEDEIAVNNKNWASGYYKLHGFVVEKGDTISREKLIYLYNSKEKLPVDKTLFLAKLGKKEYQTGEEGIVRFSSAAEKSQVFVQVEANHEIVEAKWIRLNKESKSFSFPIKKKYRGKIYIHYYFGKFNTAYRGTLTARVNSNQEKLKVTTRVFRDKLRPGEEETWELTIHAENREKVWAEVLATMYDASLDQWKSNTLTFDPEIYYPYSRYRAWTTSGQFDRGRFRWLKGDYYGFSQFMYLRFDDLNWFGFKFWFEGLFQSYPIYTMLEEVPVKRMQRSGNNLPPPSPRIPDKIEIVDDGEDIEENGILTSDMLEVEDSDFGIRGGEKGSAKQIRLEEVKARKNLQETAFFDPELHTDKKGNVVIRFTVPESLTEWKFMANAFTKDLKTGSLEKKVQTQKKLMVTPNSPRFLRAGDQVVFSVKIDNLTKDSLRGKIGLYLFDPTSRDSLNEEFNNTDYEKEFIVAKENSVNLSWRLEVPQNREMVTYRIVAATEEFSDGEENILPILTNRKLVTETLPIHVREGQEKELILENLRDHTSETREDLRLTLEMTTNPIWQAIFSLPYLRTPKYDNSISNFGQLYANLISRKVLHDNPRIKTVFSSWKEKGKLKSKLEKNQELKEILLEETPWVSEAEDETEQMRRLAFLFDINKIDTELSDAFDRLQEKQLPNGGFPWFDGGDANFYVTGYLLSNLGHLEDFGIEVNTLFDGKVQSVIEKMIDYLDREALKNLEKTRKKEDFYQTAFFRNYLWVRGHFVGDSPLPQKLLPHRDDALRNMIKRKFDFPLYVQARMVFVLEDYGHHQEAVALLKSLRDRAVQSDEMGMYWRDNRPGWFWMEAPVATHSLLTLAFDRIVKDSQSVESLKVWLLKNRQTRQWNSVKSTTEAVNALVSTGKDWISEDGDGIQLTVGDQTIDLTHAQYPSQAENGYFKTTWERAEIRPEMARVSVKKTAPGVSWGALYYQYFEDLDQIQSADSKIVMRKQLYLRKNTESGEKLQEITEDTPIRVGDMITVRLEIQADRDMQFVHVKDMRASGLEPVHVLSRYNYQHGLGYYESTRDTASHFFIDFMPKGTYVFEYDLRANNAGNFSNGVTTLQNAYAPELSAHSKGIKIRIEK